MILICDSGSTKADWVLLDGKNIFSEFQTDGLNPVHLPGEIISEIISAEKNISMHAQRIDDVHFFGSGSGNAEGRTRMEEVLKKIFPSAKISVENDLAGAAVATCGSMPGVVAILGTGSNCCFYDGAGIRIKNYGLGYILGDEGSGAWFGKNFLRAFLYGQLPEKIHAVFQSEFKTDREKAIEAVYRKPNANLYLSSFMPFITMHRTEPYVMKLLEEGLSEFFDTAISGFDESENHPVHFVGSVASLLEAEIRELGKEKNLRIGKILKRPIDGLKEHFLSK